MNWLQKNFENGGRRYQLLVVLPATLVLLYLCFLADDGYVSRAEIMVEQESSMAAAGSELALGLLSVGGGKSKQDALLAREFMKSRTMLEFLDQELGLRAHYSGDDVDLFGRLASEAPAETFLEYFQDHLKIMVDDDSLVIHIEYIAYSPDFAKAVVQKLVERTEEFINDVGQRLAREQMHFANQQVEAAHKRVMVASREMIAMQKRDEVLSPELEAEALGKILGELEVELSKQQTQLKAMLGYMNPQAPDIVALQQRILALQQQIDQERKRLVGSTHAGLNDLMLAHQDAQVNVRIATEVYKAALATFESTRLDAVRKVKYLVLIDKPSLPDSAEHPRILYWSVTIFVLLNLLYFLASLIYATVQDHKE